MGTGVKNRLMEKLVMSGPVMWKEWEINNWQRDQIVGKWMEGCQEDRECNSRFAIL